MFSLFKNQNSNANNPWKSLKLFSVYRLLIGVFLVLMAGNADTLFTQTLVDPLFDNATYLYLAFAIISLPVAFLELGELEILVRVQTIIDILLITLLMHGLGGVGSGVGWLLVVSIASASLLSQAHWALFYAAIATLCVLIEHAYRNFTLPELYEYYTQPAFISIGCFATAILAYRLAKRTQASEQLASKQKIDLENLEQINALVAQQMKDAVLVIDQQLQLRQYNPQTQQLLGIEGDIAKGKPLQVFAPAIAAKIEDWAKSRNALGIDKAQTDCKVMLNGLNYGLRIMPLDKDQETGYVIFVQDWSQQQTQAHQVKLAALGRLTANIAHEIRNPLSAISHANQLLQEDEKIDTTTKRMLKIIEDNVQRVDQIIKDVLELNRRDRTNQEDIALEPFLTEFYMQFCAIEKIAPAHFVLQIPDSHTIVRYDRRHLNQVLWNLCKNGWRHCQKEADSLVLTLDLTVSKLAKISVKDDGAGISAETQAHLFEPFFTTVSSGNGLGLYIGKELTEANGAALEYHALTRGSEFSVTIRLA